MNEYFNIYLRGKLVSIGASKFIADYYRTYFFKEASIVKLVGWR